MTNSNAISSSAASIDWPAALRQHDRWLRTVIFSRVGERNAVDDVMQEVALAAVRQAAPLMDASKVAPWLYRLAVRQTLVYRRSCGRQRKLVQRSAGSMPVEATEAEPLDWLLADERQQLVRDAVERLNRRDAEILLLKYTEGWSYRQLAEHLGVSQSAVEARLHRARGRLRGQLAACNIYEVSE